MAPRATHSFTNVVTSIIGIVIGAGIFKTPGLVAARTGSEFTLIIVWLLGGAVSLAGALCYAELATAYPNAGGEFHYLSRAWGRRLAFLFAWARMSVLQTGSIAIQAFVFGDYAEQILPIGKNGPVIYALLAVASLTALHCVSIQRAKQAQSGLTLLTLFGMILVVYAGFSVPDHSALSSVQPPANAEPHSFAIAMVFVLLTYGGWNEAVYVSAELHNPERDMRRALLWSLTLITGIFLLTNLAYLNGLGLAQFSGSEVVAADLMRTAFGEAGAKSISVLIAISTLGAMSVTILTGGRTNYALGRSFHLFRPLGIWNRTTGTPLNALLGQGVIALLLIVLGAGTRDAFETLVEYSAPVFWFFFLLTGASLIVLRRSEPDTKRPFMVPLYPLTPLLFCAVCLYMLWSSLSYTGAGALVGVAVTLLGILVRLLGGRRPGNVNDGEYAS